MYAPRTSSGASPATTVCDVGTDSISPMTKTTIIATTSGIADDTLKSRNGRPMSSIAPKSFGAAGMGADQRMTRIWKNVTSSGLTITRKPQAHSSKPSESTSDTGRRPSYET